MAQLKLMPQTNVLALPAAHAPRDKANGRTEAKANRHRPGAIQPPLPVTPQRLELIKAYANHALRSANAPTASQIAQRFAHRDEDGPPAGAPHPAPNAPHAAPFAMLASGIRRLTTLVIVAALLPNLTLAAFWLGWVEPPWSRPATPSPSESPIKAASPELALPVLSAPAKLEATAGEDVLLPIALDGTDGVPAGGVIVVKGLPHGSSLSNGRRYGETGWALRSDEIGDLYLILAGGGRGKATLEIELLAPNHPRRRRDGPENRRRAGGGDRCRSRRGGPEGGATRDGASGRDRSRVCPTRRGDHRRCAVADATACARLQ